MSDKTMTSVGYDLVIQRTGDRIDKITKAGVVIWPAERHTAGMGTQDKIHTAAQELKRSPAIGSGSTSRANDTMIGGSHYKDPDITGKCPHCQGLIEHWDWAYNLRALEYAATKYLARWRTKGGLDSLKKVIHYVQKLIEIHFPDVVVTIQYANRTEVGQANGLRREGGVQAGCREGVASGPTSHPSAVKCPTEDWGPSS